MEMAYTVCDRPPTVYVADLRCSAILWEYCHTDVGDMEA